MILSVHQPDYIPWLGHFNKVRLSDLYLIGDTVQYRHRGFTNRNKIKTDQGANWITIPVKHNFGQPILEVKISNDEQNGIRWSEKHFRTLQVCYGRARYYDKYIGIFEKIYKKKFELLVDCNIEFMNAVFEILGIDVPVKKLSDINPTGHKTELVVDICKKIGADTYLSGLGALNYINVDLLKENNIKILFNKYEHPDYFQRFSRLGFIPNLSVIDLIFNEGPNSMNILKSGFKGFDNN